MYRSEDLGRLLTQRRINSLKQPVSDELEEISILTIRSLIHTRAPQRPSDSNHLHPTIIPFYHTLKHEEPFCPPATGRGTLVLFCPRVKESS